jgi:hypothetical protein
MECVNKVQLSCCIMNYIQAVHELVIESGKSVVSCLVVVVAVVVSCLVVVVRLFNCLFV